MTWLLMLFALFLLLPYAAMALLVFFLLLFPVYLAAQSLVVLMLAPGQLAQIFFNSKLRKNHALEHATVNVLERQFGPSRISGVAVEDGFLLFGADLPPAMIANAAVEGLRRLRAGERNLAIHPRCGTSLLAAHVVFAAVFVGGLFLTGTASWMSVAIAMLVSTALAPMAGQWLQRHVTTSAEVDDVTVGALEFGGGPAMMPFGAWMASPVLVRVHHWEPAVSISDPISVAGARRW